LSKTILVESVRARPVAFSILPPADSDALLSVLPDHEQTFLRESLTITQALKIFDGSLKGTLVLVSQKMETAMVVSSDEGERDALSEPGREKLRLMTTFNRERNMAEIINQLIVPHGLSGADDEELMEIADRLIFDAKGKGR
jgi:hypothetical protein